MWRKLILPKRDLGWGLQALRVFDEKSGSKLTEISIDLSLKRSEKVDELVEIVERSRETLKSLEFGISSSIVKKECNELAWKLPHLALFKGACQPVESRAVLLVIKDKHQETITTENFNDLPSLKLLWTSASHTLLNGGLSRFKNLSSLYLEGYKDSFEWRNLLQTPSQTLKHLQMSIRETSDQVQLETLHFPRLQILEIHLFSSIFPSWISLLPFCTLINHGYTIPFALPSISTLWVSQLYDIYMLANSVPQMTELRSLVSQHDSFFSPGHALISMLRRRKQNSETGVEVEGIKAVQMERLVLYFKFFSDQEISQLRELVTEVVDLETVSKVIELEL